MAATLELHSVLRLPSLPSPPRWAIHRASIVCRAVSAASPPILVADGELEALDGRERTVARIGLPSKGRMAEETLELLKVWCLPLTCLFGFFGLWFIGFWLWFCGQACQLTVKQANPRQYVAYIPQVVWFWKFTYFRLFLCFISLISYFYH